MEPTRGIDRQHLVSLLPHLPHHLRRVLAVGVGDGEAGAFLRRRPGVEVYGLERDPDRATRTQGCFDGVVAGVPGDTLPFPTPWFDGVVFTDAPREAGGLTEALAALQPCLNPFGQCFLLLPNRDYGRLAAPLATASLDAVREAAAAAGWRTTLPASVTDEALAARGEHGATLAWLVTLSSPDYDALSHARALFDAGHPDWAYHLLNTLSEGLFAPGTTRVAVQLETMLALLAWRQRVGEEGLLEAFNRAQVCFHDVVALQPDCTPVYQCMAQFWRLLGNPDMARRTLRGIAHVVDDPSVRAQLAGLEALPDRGVPEVTAPEHDPAWRPRVLFVLHPRVHFGLDILYDGLHAVLGPGNVVDFPYKPTLHGTAPERHANYPCSFDLPGADMSLEAVLAELRTGAFDLVLHGDCEGGLDPAVTRAISEAAGDTPFCIVDALDESQDTRGAVCAQLGREGVTAYFKREMLACVDYGPNTFPLPFGFAEGRSDAAWSDYRPTRFFWAGHRQFAMRRLYLEALERALNVSLEGYYAPEDYNRIVRESLIGLNCFGYGFDTVRYWELPARGCLLLSERLPILVPHNFRDGETAVFWDDLPDLLGKLQHYLAHPEEAAAIARAGHAHFLAHHTGAARARQLLAWVRQVTGA